MIVLVVLSALLVITGCTSDAPQTPSSVPTKMPVEESKASAEETETLIEESQPPTPVVIDVTETAAPESPVFKLPVEHYSYSELGIQTPCTISKDMVGQEIIVAGTINFLEIDEDEGGIFGNFAEPLCDIGFWVDPEVVDETSPYRLSMITNDAMLLFSGQVIVTEENPDEPLIFVYTVSLMPTVVTEMIYDDWENHPNFFLMTPNILDAIDSGADIAWYDKLASQDMLFATRLAHTAGLKLGIFISLNDIEWSERLSLEPELADAVAIDIDGKPIIAWSSGYIYDTNHPQWQEFLLKKLKEAVDVGVDAVFIDDNEGNGWWSNNPLEGYAGVFSEVSMQSFREFLKSRYSPDELAQLNIPDIDAFDYRQYLINNGFTKAYIADQIRQQWIGEGYNPIDIPLFIDFQEFQNQSTFQFLEHLILEVKNYAIETRGREILFTGFPLDILVPSNYAQFELYDFVTPISFRAWRGGFPPLGRSTHWYKMLYAASQKPAALGPQDTDPEIMPLLDYNAQNLIKLRFAEAVASQGSISPKSSLSNPDWGSIENEIEFAFDLYPETLREYSAFLRENALWFDSESTQALADIALVYSLPSLSYDKLTHINSWEGIANLLAHLHMPYEVIFFGDGIHINDTVTSDALSRYSLVILSHALALTENQEIAIVEYLEAGGALVAYGPLGEVDENQLPVNRTALSEASWQDSPGVYWFPESSIGDEYYRYVAYHPVVTQFGEAPENRVSEDRAVQIRDEVKPMLKEIFPEMLIEGNLSLQVGIQPYLVNETLIIHLVNFDYQFETDSVVPNQDITFSIRIPNGFEPDQAYYISPDFNEKIFLEYEWENDVITITVPTLEIWGIVQIESES
ncbi:MAG: hypothetical protein ISS57_00020 [Anaerolineales bacterium]|nr:hypothetical protein [Anaerolineales bacterium]